MASVVVGATTSEAFSLLRQARSLRKAKAATLIDLGRRVAALEAEAERGEGR